MSYTVAYFLSRNHSTMINYYSNDLRQEIWSSLKCFFPNMTYVSSRRSFLLSVRLRSTNLAATLFISESLVEIRRTEFLDIHLFLTIAEWFVNSLWSQLVEFSLHSHLFRHFINVQIEVYHEWIGGLVSVSLKQFHHYMNIAIFL